MFCSQSKFVDYFKHILGIGIGLGFDLGLSLRNHCMIYLQSTTMAADSATIVTTNSGRIRGTETVFLKRLVRSYLGVPFAEPPIGRYRFRPASAKRPWNGTLDATELSPACYQGRDTYNETFWGSEMWNANTRVSEDCLYMNIWAPANAANLSVMVWLFGGGYYYGSPSLILYDGRALALEV